MGLFKDCGCGCGGAKARDKFVISVISALLFFIIANPGTFIIVRKIFGQWVSSPNGCPSIAGLALHAIVFFFIVWGMMHIRKEGFEAEAEAEPEAEAEAEAEVEDEGEDEEYMSEISFAPAPEGVSKLNLGSIDISADEQSLPAPSKKAGKYTSCKCSDGDEIMIMR